jgi:hypothetical protein
MQKQIVYFEGMGEKYSEEVLEIVKERLGAGDIKKAVVASTRGHTAKLAAKRLRESGVQLVIVPHQFGFKKENVMKAYPSTQYKKVRVMEILCKPLSG